MSWHVLESARPQSVEVAGAADDRLGERVLGLAFDGGDQAQQLVLADAVGDHVGDLRLALGQGAGLVHHHDLDAGGGFECHGVLEQHAAFRAETGTDHDRGRCGQPEGVRTSDDHHGDGEQHGRRERSAGQQPDRERETTTDERHEHQPERRAVREPLTRCLGVLGFLHELDDLRERGVGADLGRPDPQRAVGVDRGADDDRARRLVHRQALTGHHRLVNLGLALLDDAVHRDLRTWSHEQQVTDHDLCRRHLHRLTVTQHDRLGRREVEKGADRVVGAAAGTHLEPVTQQDEGCQHGRGFVEDLSPAGQRDHHGVQPARADRDGHQHHHVERACPQRPPGAVEEDPARVEDHRQAQQQRPHVRAQPERRGQVQPEHLGADRRPQHDRDGEQHRHQEPVAHVGGHRGHRHARVTAVAHHLVR